MFLKVWFLYYLDTINYEQNIVLLCDIHHFPTISLSVQTAGGGPTVMCGLGALGVLYAGSYFLEGSTRFLHSTAGFM